MLRRECGHENSASGMDTSTTAHAIRPAVAGISLQPCIHASHIFSIGAASDAQKMESGLEVFNSRIGDHEPLSSTSELIRQKPLSDLIDEQFSRIIGNVLSC